MTRSPTRSHLLFFGRDVLKFQFVLKYLLVLKYFHVLNYFLFLKCLILLGFLCALNKSVAQEATIRAVWREPLFMEGASSHESNGGSFPHPSLPSHPFSSPRTSPFCPGRFGLWFE